MSAPQPTHGLPLPPPDAPPHVAPPPRGQYDPSWRPPAGTRPPQYTGPPRDMKVLPPPDAPFGPSGSLSAPPTTSRPPSELAQPPASSYRPPMNGAPPEGGHAFPPPVGYANEPNGSHPPPLPMLNTAESMPATNVRPSPYTPTTPMAHSASYDGYFFNQAGSRPRRTQRATQACDQCRTRKARCDEGRPTCSGCKDMNLQCVYKEVPPHKHERSTQLVLEQLREIKDSMKQMQENLEELRRGEDGPDESFQRQMTELLEKHLGAQTARLDAKLGSLPEQGQSQAVPLTVKPETESKPKAVSATPPNVPATVSYNKFNSIEPDQIKAERLEPIDRDLSLPTEHTTAAHKLLSWPAIQKLLPVPMDEEYVMQIEEARGPLRPYGRGESDSFAGYACSPTAGSPGSPQEEAFPAASAWGVGFVPPPARQYQIGGLNADGTLNTNQKTIWEYHDSFLRNMHILHPFLDERGLYALIQNFIRTYSPGSSSNNSNVPHHFYQTGDGSATLPRGSKRKRSSDIPYNISGTDERRPSCLIPMIERSTENAIVLLVLALGAICSWKDELPGPVRDTSWAPTSPYVSVHNSPGNMAHSFHSPTESSFPPMSNLHQRRFSGPSQPPLPAGDTPDQLPRNMHIIPGMAYYAYAADILGCHQGSCTLQYAQACLLAGLYAGQVAHPFASHAWIREAARAVQVIMRLRRYNSSQREPVHTTFYSCLQLESDILAELDLPDSGISRWKDPVSWPQGLPTNNVADNAVIQYYTIQLYLRKTLNDVHAVLYRSDRDRNDPDAVLRAALRCEEWRTNLFEQWRKSLPPDLAWDDNDPPSSDINAARMRAKYYGGTYIVHRPLLLYALSLMYPKPSNSAASPAVSIASSAKSQASPSLTQHSEAMERRFSDMGPPGRNVSTPEQLYPQQVSWKNLDQKIRDGCEICVQAAINSTIAFDRIQGRPIVTNIFGTAHAQFGNLLVLSATYVSPHLSSLINGERLLGLLNRTIDFLNQSRHISPTLKRDAEILGMIKNKIFPSTANTSFSGSG